MLQGSRVTGQGTQLAAETKWSQPHLQPLPGVGSVDRGAHMQLQGEAAPRVQRAAEPSAITSSQMGKGAGWSSVMSCAGPPRAPPGPDPTPECSALPLWVLIPARPAPVHPPSLGALHAVPPRVWCTPFQRCCSISAPITFFSWEVFGDSSQHPAQAWLPEGAW